MLKKIALTTLFALSAALATAGTVSAHTASTKKAPVPSAPKGFCPIIGIPC